MSALFANRRVAHLRFTGHHFWSIYVSDERIAKHRNCFDRNQKLFRVKLQKVVLHVILKYCKGLYVNVC